MSTMFTLRRINVAALVPVDIYHVGTIHLAIRAYVTSSAPE